MRQQTAGKSRSSSRTRRRMRKMMMMNSMNDTHGFVANSSDVKKMFPFQNPSQLTGDNMDPKEKNLQILQELLSESGTKESYNMKKKVWRHLRAICKTHNIDVHAALPAA